MSLCKTEKVDCPSCGHAQEVAIWGSVNVTADPHLKRAILSGEINGFECPACRFQCRVECDMLYHDMKRRLAIWLRTRTRTACSVWRTFPGFPVWALWMRHTHVELCRRTKSGGKGQNPEGGLDDREVELIKLLVCINDGIDVGTPMLFTKWTCTGATEIASSFCFPGNGEGDAVEQSYPSNLLQKRAADVIRKLFATNAPIADWPYINRKFVLDLLTSSGSLTRID